MLILEYVVFVSSANSFCDNDNEMSVLIFQFLLFVLNKA